MKESKLKKINQLKEAIEENLNSHFDDWETRIKLRKELKELEES